MHGGARGSGGPRGTRNGNYKHGRYTAEAKQKREHYRQWITEQTRLVDALLERVRELMGCLDKEQLMGRAKRSTLAAR